MSKTSNKTIINHEFQLLELKAMYSQQALLNITCSVKSRARTVILTRSNRDQELAFNILGGKETGYGIFISHVEPNTVAEKNGLKRGDEVKTKSRETRSKNLDYRSERPKFQACFSGARFGYAS